MNLQIEWRVVRCFSLSRDESDSGARALDCESESPRVLVPGPLGGKASAGRPRASHLVLTEPISCLEFNYLVERIQTVITNSGGVTEGTTVTGVPCLTLRDSTERPETVTLGTNELIGTNPARIPPAVDRLFVGRWKTGRVPPLWDGKTGERIVAQLERVL